MASRLLTKRIPSGVNSKIYRPLPSLKNLSSQINGKRTQTTILPNGFTVATEHFPHLETATVGVWIDSGSRSENAKNNGSAHFLEHMAFKGTNKRSQQDIELMVENMGAHLNAYTSREQTVFFAKSFKNDIPKVVDILSDILQNSTLENSAIERERGVILREQEEVDKMTEEVIFDHLHATAFQGNSLGYTILGPKENILSIQRKDLLEYIESNYRADRMLLVGVGAVDHQHLVDLAQQYFGNLKTSDKPVALNMKPSPPHFYGSEIRIRNDDMKEAHIGLAIKGVGWKDPDFYTMLVLQAMIGNWDRSYGSAPYLTTKLAQRLNKHQLANSYMSFNTSYSDTGLWGTYLVSENVGDLDETVFFTVREWAKLAIDSTQAEVEKAKLQLKASILLNLDGTTAVAEDIGRQILTTGHRKEPNELERLIDQISLDDVRRVANKFIWDAEIAVVGLGKTEAIPDYNRVRGCTSLNRF